MPHNIAMPASFVQMLEDDHKPTPHPLHPEAQAANLLAAFDHYRSVKTFTPGQLVRCRPGLSIFDDEPVVSIYVRRLDPDDAQDWKHIADELRRNRWNKIDCVIARTIDTGATAFMSFDSDLLEPFEA